MTADIPFCEWNDNGNYFNIGSPDENLGFGLKWPGGWMRAKSRRRSGATEGQVDKYYFSPIWKYKLRSKREVEVFLQEQQSNGGDEFLAIRAVHAYRRT
jgi:hypothetical protein